jgi:acyl-CoA dehydrogenase
MDANELIAPFERLIADCCAPVAIRAFERSGDASVIWSGIEESGFLDALVPEEKGGAGLSLPDIFPLVLVLGAHGVPLPVAETMVARSLLARAGIEAPAGPITLTDDQTALSAIIRPEGGFRPIAAIVKAALIAGAANRVLTMTVDYANQRIQFGKPIGKQQALQQSMAVMAEQCVAARIAAEMGFSRGLPPAPGAAATAKFIASSAAASIAAAAHAVHGAIGISEEYDLQLLTRRLHEWRLAEGSESYWAARMGEARLSARSSSIDFVRSAVFGETAPA